MDFDLVDVTKDDRLSSLKILEEHVKKLGKDCPYIYIGKTHIEGNSKPFDKTNQETWNLNAIKGRKRDHYRRKGLTNLTVIGVITNAEVPLISTRSIEHNILKEQYALSLESEIINRLRFSDFGDKLVNATSNAGNLKKKDCDGFVIYMAYGNTLSEAYTSTPCELTSMPTSSLLTSPNPVNSPGSIIHNEATNTSLLTHCDTRQEQSFKFKDIEPVNSPGSNMHNKVTAPVFPPPVLTDHDDLQTLDLRSTVTSDYAAYTTNPFESPQASLYGHNDLSVTSSSKHRRSKHNAKQRHEKTPYERKRSKTSVVFYGIDTGHSTERIYDRKCFAYYQIRPLVKKLPQIDTNDWKDGNLWIESMTLLLGKESGCPVCIDFHSEQTATEILNNKRLFVYHKIIVEPYF